ncbi:hypothetical protein DCS_04889 [Drechmeria coniospora]|uniref:Calcineurin-like phosphoesterase domain-containing protein n=1 Tax=Drechmeria coniospora TaxID=98403 RepID=A0A151GLB0_DRECN|nr:hypothetical protein DCS_04889 [Drechmeria coniospora]KYK57876.1 hypothetical protein DCS_04889 [Drechmeria coniospora]
MITMSVPHLALHRAMVCSGALFFITSVCFGTMILLNQPTDDPAPVATVDAPDDAAAAAADLDFDPLLAPTFADMPMSYGGHGRPHFENLKPISDLPSQFVPTVKNKRRLIMIGDIHGMDKELAQLLDRVRFDEAADHLVAVGDMVTKGPSSAAVVDRLMALNASAVRGNHEDKVLLVRAELEERKGVSEALAGDITDFDRGEKHHVDIANNLTPRHIGWLSDLPVILTIKPLSMYVVHAGLVPGVDVDRQNPWAVMNMRTLGYPREDIRREEQARLQQGLSEVQPSPSKSKRAAEVDVDHDRDVAVPIEDHSGEHWPDAWNRWQKMLPKDKRRTIIYGHDARRGYLEDLHTVGLDTGCVRGGALTAIIIEGTRGGGWKHRREQVWCSEPA